MPANHIVLPGLPFSPIPHDRVELLVAVDRERCTPPPAIANFDKTWQSASIFELVTRGAMYFTDHGTVVGEGETMVDAKRRRVWQDLVNARPASVEVDGRTRLVFGGWDQSDEQGRQSMLLGEAVAVLMCERMFGVSYAAITRVGGKHDHEFITAEGMVKLEARARFNRGGHKAAVDAIDSKFARSRNYARAVAVLTFPSDSAVRSIPDVEVLDPEGDGGFPSRSARIRVALRHYLQYARSSGLPLSRLYSFLLSLGDDELLTVYAQGNVLDNAAPPVGLLAGSSVMQIGSGIYIGRVMTGFAAPTWLNSRGTGVVFVGLLESVLETSLSSSVESLLTGGIQTETGMTGSSTYLSRFTDGSLFAWAPDDQSLVAAGLRLLPRAPVRAGSWRQLGPDTVSFVSGPEYSVASPIMSTMFHAAYWAHNLRLAHPRDQVASLTRSLGNARVDLNPHQIEAALFALRSPYSRGVLLADEVGLGKTIEASLVMAQKWAERRRHILLIAPATLRKQWQLELQQKFFLPSVILEARTWNDRVRRGTSNPFDTSAFAAVIICSYQFAYAKRADLVLLPWDLVVIDEAHRLRNVYKGEKAKTAVAIAEAIAERRKLLLTATPLQNSLLELHGLVSILDPSIFGDLDQFQEQFVRLGGFADVNQRDVALRARIAPVCKRTLRRDVTGFVNFTARHAVTAEFTNTESEQELYDEVSAFLQREELLVLPSGQRPLLTLVLRKLLASSTRAISATLAKLVARLEDESLLDDYEVPEDPASDDPSREADTSDAVATVAPPAPPVSDSAATSEMNDLRRFISMAEGVAKDSKAEQLLARLPEVLDKAVAHGAKRKAVIFTESRKTQAYLAELLTEHGFRGQVVLLNGTNSDASSKQTYDEYKKRHHGRWAEVSSGSKTADMKAAIVEEFASDRGTILLATESAAEGVNLQFCSVVMNYDLPWNPQRIEQRIGRCHRYGQRSDVLVVNFVNKSNQADVRVYQLLGQKLRLFEGVFGASDDVLGATAAAGLDLEQAISKIYQRCRTTDEINHAFDALQAELDEMISTGRGEARQAVLDHLDATIHDRLAIHRDQAKAALGEQQQQLLDLVRFAWSDRATFISGAPRFTLNDDGASRGYNLDWRDAEECEEEFFRVDHPKAIELIDSAARIGIAPEEVTFAYAAHASALGSYVGKAGWLDLTQLTVTALDRPEQFLLVVACDDDGVELPADVAARLFSLDGRVAPLDNLAAVPERLATLRGVAASARVVEADRRNQSLLEAEGEKIDRRTEDEKEAVTRRIAALEMDVKGKRKAARLMATLDEQVQAKREYEAAKRQLDQARRSQYDEIDRLEAEAEQLTAAMQSALRDRTVTETNIATLRWRLVPTTTTEA